MNKLIKIITGFALVIGVLCLLLAASGNSHVIVGLTKTYLRGISKPDIDDYDDHHLREVKAAEVAQPWSSVDPIRVMSQTDDEFCQSIGTVAYIVLVDGKVVCKQYWEGYNDTAISNSFSMAKTFAATCIGHAVENGLIDDLDDPVTKYLSGMSIGLNAQLTIRHLLQMSSGIDFGESYADPFGYQAMAYYGSDLEAATRKFSVTEIPGKTWKYEGGNTVILSLILREVSGLTLSEYFSTYFWSQIGAKNSAWWNIDRPGGLEKSFSAFYASAPDYARFGQLFLDSGEWRGVPLISKKFMIESTTPVMIPDPNGELVWQYGYHWWLGKWDGHNFYSARGMDGQYIACVPHLNMVMVRLGHERIQVYENHASLDLYQFLDIAKSIAE